MSDLIQRLRDAYTENPASALKLIPEVLQAADDRSEILQKAIDTYGPAIQEDICIEEMSELTKAIIKHRRAYGNSEIAAGRENVKEEIADVQIMLDQIRILYGDTTEQENFKLERLRKRLEAGS